MTQEQIISDYKKSRNIKDDYALNEDEMYFIEQIYNLHQERTINDFINSIDNKVYNKIRRSHSDASCRRYLKEHYK